MRIALFHNRYLQRGGEDTVFDTEVDLLRKAGHEVHTFVVDNRESIGRSPLKKLRAGWRARFNADVHARVLRFLDDHPVDVGHVHNFFPVLSPAVHLALRARGVPVVQTLHNYRLLCANGLFLRDDRPCEDCVVRGPWNAVRYGCYRGSRVQTAVWAEMTAHHRRLGTWQRAVDVFVALSSFSRRKLVAGGLPADRVYVKPNPVADPGEPTGIGRGGLYVGRLSREKGVHLLLEAWRSLDGYPLTIVGSGAEETALRALARDIPGVRFTGPLPPEEVAPLRRACAFAIAPSLCYEHFPMAVAEAMAAGRPSVAPRDTALADLVENGFSGLLFERGDSDGLAAACRELTADRERCAEMGRFARARYEDALAPERSVERLIALYETARRMPSAIASG
jgi:glycosyltransferase involved in cell wall biosynthesis